MPGLGHRSFLQIAKEATWGTFVKPYDKLEIISWSVAPQIGVIQDPSLYAAQSRRGMFQGGLLFKGTFVVRLNYEGLEELFRAVFGTAGYSGVVVAGTVMDHTFKEGSTLTPLSMEVSVGDVPAGKVFKLSGCKVMSLTVRGTAGSGTDAMLQAEFTVLAKDCQSNQTATIGSSATEPAVGPITALTTNNFLLTRASGSFVTDGVKPGMTIIHPNVPPGTVVSAVVALTVNMSASATVNASGLSVNFSHLNYPTTIPVLYHQATTIDDGTADASGSVRVRSFEVTLENPHAEDRFYLGSVNIDEPLRSDFLTARWRLTQEFTTQTQFDAARNFTEGSPKLVFQHPTLIDGTNKREFEMRSNRANLVEFTDPVEGYGVLISTATWEAFYDDASDLSALVARFRNNYPALA